MPRLSIFLLQWAILAKQPRFTLRRIARRSVTPFLLRWLGLAGSAYRGGLLCQRTTIPLGNGRPLLLGIVIIRTVI